MMTIELSDKAKNLLEMHRNSIYTTKNMSNKKKDEFWKVFMNQWNELSEEEQSVLGYEWDVIQNKRYPQCNSYEDYLENYYNQK